MKSRNRVQHSAVRITSSDCSDIEESNHGPRVPLHYPRSSARTSVVIQKSHGEMEILFRANIKQAQFTGTPSKRRFRLKMNLLITSDQEQMEMETPHSSRVNSPPIARSLMLQGKAS
ncbi:hypothetical protein Tco_0102825 [Tanacetum coccineum]